MGSQNQKLTFRSIPPKIASLAPDFNGTQNRHFFIMMAMSIITLVTEEKAFQLKSYSVCSLMLVFKHYICQQSRLYIWSQVYVVSAEMLI